MGTDQIEIDHERDVQVCRWHESIFDSDGIRDVARAAAASIVEDWRSLFAEVKRLRAENATLRAERDRADEVCRLVLDYRGKPLYRVVDAWAGLDAKIGSSLESWAAGKGEPKPAPEPAKPTCGKCGRSDEAVAYVGERPTLCRPCHAEASRVAGLRARLVELLNKDNVPVRSYHSGNAGLCIGVEDDNAVVEAAGVPGRFRWALRTLIILVPEGESHE